MITYNDIYEALRKERYGEQLQPLPKDFIEQVAEYLAEKKEVSEKQGDMFSDAILKAKKQLENAISLFREMMMRRKKKILQLSFIARETGISKKDFETMLVFEKEMFDKIVAALGDADAWMNCLLFGQSKKANHQLVRFLEDTSEFLGLNGESVGPFKKADFANLPVEIAKILCEAKKCEVVETDA